MTKAWEFGGGLASRAFVRLVWSVKHATCSGRRVEDERRSWHRLSVRSAVGLLFLITEAVTTSDGAIPAGLVTGPSAACCVTFYYSSVRLLGNATKNLVEILAATSNTRPILRGGEGKTDPPRWYRSRKC
jgi:hypothetical protein